MRRPRIYQAIQAQPGEEISLSEQASRHLCQVLRMQGGESFILFNGSGQAWQGQLLAPHRQAARAVIQNVLATNTESPLKIHLGLGISKGERMDIAIQKAVELGVTSITPLFTRYSMVKLDEKKRQKRLEHWQGVIISACEQCGRNLLPTINPVIDNSAWLRSVDDEQKLVLDPRSATSLSSIKHKPSSISLYIGPEGGLTDDEVSAALENNFTGLKLGPRILRTETAVISAITAAQLYWGDMN